MPASYEQGYNALAKASTRLYVTGASITACTADLSQYGQNLTAGTSCVFQASPGSARLDFSHPRTIGAVITANNTDTGTIFRHGSASPTRFAFSSANNLRATVNNATAGTLAITGLDGTRDVLVVAWTSRANPDTTGASDAVSSTLHCWNVTNGTYQATTFTHEASTTKTQTAFFGAADNASTAVFSGGITSIWFENREQSWVEIEADWVSTYTPPTSDFAVDLQGIPPQADTIDAENYHHGPAAIWAVDATARLQRRTLTPFYNDRCHVQTTWQTTNLSGPFVRQVAGDVAWRMPLGYLQVRAVPDTCNAIAAAVHARVWSTSSAVPVGLRVYTMSRPPGVFGAGPLERYFSEVVISRDDDASGGAWSVFDPIPIARGRGALRRGKTYLAIAIAIDPYGASGSDADARAVINAVQIVPGFLDPAGGGQFGLQQP